MKKELVMYWKQLGKSVNRRSQRERVLLLITGVVAIWVYMYIFYVSNLGSEYANLNEEYVNLQEEFEGTNRELSILQSKLNKNAGVKESTEYQRKIEELNANKQTLIKLNDQLMTPQKIPYLLESLLQDFAGLQLLNVETMPLQASKQIDAQDQDTILFRQGIKLTFTGDYQSLVNYLKKVEKLPYPIRWEELEYTIEEFPKAKIVLVVYTLSDTKNWISR